MIYLYLLIFLVILAIILWSFNPMKQKKQEPRKHLTHYKPHLLIKKLPSLTTVMKHM